MLKKSDTAGLAVAKQSVVQTRQALSDWKAHAEESKGEIKKLERSLAELNSEIEELAFFALVDSKKEKALADARARRVQLQNSLEDHKATVSQAQARIFKGEELSMVNLRTKLQTEIDLLVAEQNADAKEYVELSKRLEEIRLHDTQRTRQLDHNRERVKQINLFLRRREDGIAMPMPVFTEAI